MTEWNPGELALGALADPIHKQMGLEENETELEQADLDALNRLRIRGVIPERLAWNSSNKVIKKLITRLEKEGRISKVTT